MVLSGMEENKKSGGGDVRAKAPSWDIAARKKSRFAEKKSASPKKNYAYSLQDKIMFVDRCRWGHGCDGAAAKKGFSLLCGRKILRPYI